MSLVIPDELIQASGLSEAEGLQELVLLLFQHEKITLGSASRFLGLTQLEFQALLAEKGLCVHYDVADLHEDVQILQELGLLWMKCLRLQEKQQQVERSHPRFSKIMGARRRFWASNKVSDVGDGLPTSLILSLGGNQ